MRNRLARSTARMHARHLDPMVLDLYALPAQIGMPIYKAWNAKEDLLDLLAPARSHSDRTEISKRRTRCYAGRDAAWLPPE